MNKAAGVLKSLILGYAVTVIALLILSVCLYKLSITNNVVDIGIYIIYGIASFAGGLKLAKTMGKQRLVWGIIYGVLYAVILFIVSVAVSKGAVPEMKMVLKTTALCIVTGAIGGIISP